MKKTDDLPLHFKTQGKEDDPDGVYLIPHPTINEYFYNVIFSSRAGWEHLSVSIIKIVSRSRRTFKAVERCPTWAEMCFLKNMFWNPSEATVQFHPAMADYVNNHEFVLHIFKPIGIEFPSPPSILVGLTDDVLTNLLGWLESELPGKSKEEYLSMLYYADYTNVNLRDEKSIAAFKNKMYEEIKISKASL